MKLNTKDFGPAQKRSYLGDVIKDLKEGKDIAQLRKQILIKLAANDLSGEQIAAVKKLGNGELKALLLYGSAWQGIHETLHGRAPKHESMDQTVKEINKRNHINNASAPERIAMHINAMDKNLDVIHNLELSALKNHILRDQVSEIAFTLRATHEVGTAEMPNIAPPQSSSEHKQSNTSIAQAAAMPESKFANPFVGLISFIELKPPKSGNSDVYLKECARYQVAVGDLTITLGELSASIANKVEDVEITQHICEHLEIAKNRPLASLAEDIADLTCQYLKQKKGSQFTDFDQRSMTREITQKVLQEGTLYEDLQKQDKGAHVFVQAVLDIVQSILINIQQIIGPRITKPSLHIFADVQQKLIESQEEQGISNSWAEKSTQRNAVPSNKERR